MVFLVAITRPEAPVYVVAFYVALVSCARHDDVPFRIHLKRVARAAAITAALYIVFLVWRRIGYGDWWPNTYYAKVTGDSSLHEHFRDYVAGQLLRYAWSAVFAFSVLGLLVAAQLQALARCLLLFLVAALTLPITAGADWMGEHRFGTAFLVVAHVTYAAVIAVCVARFRDTQRRAWPALSLTIVVVLVVPGLLVYERLAGRKLGINDVTVALVARYQGGARWLQQMRLGLPYPVVLLPDAGGSLLVGGMQFGDTASLADFQLPRILKYDAANAWTLLNQYQQAEKQPDLIDFNRNSGAVDDTLLGTRFLARDSHFGVRRDLVAVESLDTGAALLIDTPGIKVYLSPDTVQRAFPGALVRCEVLVVWSGAAPDASTRIRVSIAGDHDEISLVPYQSGASGIERRGLLVGAPLMPAAYDVVIELQRDEQTIARAKMFALRVSSDTRDLEQAASALTEGATPQQAAKRVAWLREQTLRRFSTQYFHVVMRALDRGRMSSGTVGLNIMRLRWNARLAAHQAVPAALRKAETAVAANLLAACTMTTAEASAERALCIGRAIDDLRRLGYLGTLKRFPGIASELQRARAGLAQRDLAGKYVTLVGLTLADPSDVSLQRSLLSHRRALAITGGYPPL